MAILVKVGGGTPKAKVGNPLIPPMVSNTSPSGYVVTCSRTSYSDAYKCFSEDSRTAFPASGSGGYVQIQLPNPKIAKAIYFLNGVSEQNPSSVTVLGSNDGNNWDSLYSFNPTFNVVHLSTFENDKAYLYYRFYMYASDYANATRIQLFDNDPREYLYKDGKQNVAWDNGIYNTRSDWYLDGGWDINDSSVSADSVNGVAHTRTFVTNKSVDVTDYSKIRLSYVSGSSNIILELNVSSLIGSYYLCIDKHNSGSAYELSMRLSETKENFFMSQVGTFALANVTNQTTYINRIWLDK